MLPLSSAPAGAFSRVKFVLMDIDDTLTRNGRLQRESYDALWLLHERGFRVIPITGRPAGWCDLIAREWPVDGVVGENGAFALYVDDHSHARWLFHPNAIKPEAGGVLDRVKARCLAEVPGCRVASDQFCRMFDLAIDFAEDEPRLDLASAERIRAIAAEEGAEAKVSSIHVNVWLGKYDKLGMASLFLSSYFGLDPIDYETSVAFAGDSPNDEPMFGRFPLSCGVANVGRFIEGMNKKPGYLAGKPNGCGFEEYARMICGLSENR